MKYVLDQEEYDTLVNKKSYLLELEKNVKVNEKLDTALHYFKSGGECDKIKYNGFCDNCIISSMHLKKGMKICNDERYSK